MSARPRAALSVAACLAAAVIAGCATGGGGPAATGPLPTDSLWPTSTREHVDLWLHGYAVLTTDTARVPFFLRNYRQRMRQLKGQRNVVTQLDANFDRLSSRFLANPALVNGQFVPLYFSSFQQIQDVANVFLRAGGDPRMISDASMQPYFQVLNGAFPTQPDRDWLRLFLQSLSDESNRFYHDYWTSEQQLRAPARSSVDSLWRVYRPKLRRFLNNTQQENGELILSLPLDGEGRTVNFNRRQNAITVEFPAEPSQAANFLFVFAHEAVNSVIGPAIADNTTPAEQRAGLATNYTTNASVRAGAMLIQRIAPDLVNDYMRHYLRSAGIAVPSGDPTNAFTAAFPLPDVLRDAIARQLDLVMGGI
jgi:hypothetical protein